jgi:hypothetical protein
MKAGDRVQLRPPGEILATLDEQGSLEGLPFMPEMLRFFGRTFTVKAQVARACDTIGYTGVRRLRETVVLNGPRCDGSAHGGCQAQCLLYWKEAWLQPASADPRDGAADGAALAQLERLAAANVAGADSTPEQPTWRCQATELLRASEPVPRWSMRSFVGEVRSGNVGIRRFVTVMLSVLAAPIGRRLGLFSRTQDPFHPEQLNRNGYETPPARGLRAGQLVRIRRPEEIAATLGQNGRHRGLWFDKEMVPYCGQTARVKTNVERIVDERNGRMIELKSEAYILEGIVCQSYRSDGRWFCPRAIYPYWRECWLEPVEDTEEAAKA